MSLFSIELKQLYQCDLVAKTNSKSTLNEAIEVAITSIVRNLIMKKVKVSTTADKIANIERKI